jgi:uncharacterized OsmC-like protein
MSTTTETELNGLSLPKLQQLVQVVTKDPNAAAPLNKWNARVKWKGGFKSEAYVREHSFLLDEPADLAGVNTGPKSVEYLLSSLGGCYIVGFVLNATKKGIKVDDVEVALEGNLDNILTFFGLSDKGHAGFREIKAKLYARTKGDRKIVEDVWKETVAGSPVSNSLSRNVTVVPELAITR